MKSSRYFVKSVRYFVKSLRQFVWAEIFCENCEIFCEKSVIFCMGWDILWKLWDTLWKVWDILWKPRGVLSVHYQWKFMISATKLSIRFLPEIFLERNPLRPSVSVFELWVYQADRVIIHSGPIHYNRISGELSSHPPTWNYNHETWFQVTTLLIIISPNNLFDQFETDRWVLWWSVN